MLSIFPGSGLPSARKCEDRLDSGPSRRDEVSDDPHSLALHATVAHQTREGPEALPSAQHGQGEREPNLSLNERLGFKTKQDRTAHEARDGSKFS